MLKTLFWSVFEILLIVATIVFVFRCQSIWNMYKKIKSDYERSVAKNTTNINEIRTTGDISMALIKCRGSFIRSVLFLLFISYEVIDCFITYIIK